MVSFSRLSPEVVERIVDKFVMELDAQLNEKKVFLDLTPRARKYLAEKGYDPTFGARPMARLIQQEVKRPLADEILFGRLKDGGKAAIDEQGGELRFTFEPAAPAESRTPESAGETK
jgi:ATP-dependent Clp protease ATP-binding subunit ClpA